MCKSLQYNSPYLSQLLNIIFNINRRSNSFHFVPQKCIVTFPWIFEYGNSAILELDIMGTKLITFCWTERFAEPNYYWQKWCEYQDSHSPRYVLMEAWIHFNESVRNSVWISCVLKKIFQSACSSPWDYGVLPVLIANPWICHSQFYILCWHSSSLLYRFVVCFLVCHVYLRVTMTSSIAQCTDMDWALLCVSHIQRGMFYVQIFVYHTYKEVRFMYRYVRISD